MPLYEKRRGIEVQRQQRWQRWQTGEGHAREVQRCRGAEVAEVADRRCPCLRSTEVQGCRDAEVAEVADRRGPRMRRAEVWRHFRIRKGIALIQEAPACAQTALSTLHEVKSTNSSGHLPPKYENESQGLLLVAFRHEAACEEGHHAGCWLVVDADPSRQCVRARASKVLLFERVVRLLERAGVQGDEGKTLCKVQGHESSAAWKQPLHSSTGILHPLHSNLLMPCKEQRRRVLVVLWATRTAPL
eukprot:1158233-Pelagomonas_calceolata.AAC.14